ncbi:glucosaminidase domain-containing protein [Paraclostridium bifermentans]|nr:glucosaminidase domain-containing protein [Paraclostridium bifermentans]
MAQAILESGWGQSRLAKDYNNLFGIKADVNWKGSM